MHGPEIVCDINSFFSQFAAHEAHRKVVVSRLHDLSVDIKKTWEFLDDWIHAKESQIATVQLDCGFETTTSLKMVDRSDGQATKVAKKVMDVLKNKVGPSWGNAWLNPS